MSGAAINVRGLTHHYGSGSRQVSVLEDLDLDVEPGGYVAVIGASGAGKSTLLALLGGLDASQSGQIEVGGHDLHGLSRNGLADFRRDTVGFVFQHFGLLETLTATENVALARSLAGASARASTRDALAMLDAVGLAARGDHAPAALSGGERQRVAIARALVNEPRLVLADEPTGNLDDESTALIVDLLESLPTTSGCTIVVVTHDLRLAARADHQYRLQGGRLHRGATDDPARLADRRASTVDAHGFPSGRLGLGVDEPPRGPTQGAHPAGDPEPLGPAAPNPDLGSGQRPGGTQHPPAPATS